MKARGIVKTQIANGRTSATPTNQFQASIRAKDPTRNSAVRMKAGDIVRRRHVCFHKEIPSSSFLEPKVR